MLELFFWLRYLRKKKIVSLSIAAVALSCGLLIVVASLFSGFIETYQRSAIETIGQVVVTPPIRFAKYPEFIKLLTETSQVEAATASLSTQALLHLGRGNVRPVRVLGIEPVSRSKVLRFKQTLLRQNDSPDAVSFETENSVENFGGFVGIAVIAEPDEKSDEYDFDAAGSNIGQRVVLTAAAQNSADQQKQFKRKTLVFTITDIVFTGIYDLDKNFVYLPIEQLQNQLYPDEAGPVTDQLQIKLREGTDTAAALAQIRRLWEAFASQELGWSTYIIGLTDVTTAEQLQAAQIAEFRKQMGILLLIFGVISGSVVLLIFCIFYMIVMTRQKDIAIMKTSGAANSSVGMIFVGFGCCVGLVGSAFGLVLGYAVTKNINTIEDCIRAIFGLKLWKSSVYLFSEIPNQLDWSAAFTIIVFAVAAAAIGAVVPAAIAARTRPVDILRYE
ncbi:MAG: ABC transporter permease [Planctomycetota bacterium]